MTEQYDKIIDSLASQSVQDIAPDFGQEVWSHVSRIEQKQLARGRNGVAAVMLIVALSAGMMTGEQKAFANDSQYVLSGGADYSPASLLHVSP